MILEVALLPVHPGDEESFEATFAEAQRIIVAQRSGRHAEWPR